MTARPISYLRTGLVAAACAALALAASPARAESTATSLEQARQDAARVKNEIEQIARAYADANTKLNLTEQRMIETRQDIARAQEEKGALDAQLDRRTSAAYQLGGLGFFQVLLNGRSFQDFSIRYNALQRQSQSGEAVALALRRKGAELQAEQDQLAEERSVEAEQAATLREQGSALTISFGDAQNLAASLQGKLTASDIGQLFRMGGSAPGLRIPLATCPVNGPHFVSNDFGAPRDGGSRPHQGNDILAPMDTPIVAPLPGTIALLQSGGKGGLAVFETGVGNVELYFAHESEITARAGEEVSAGQEIGRVGNTGNAAGGPSHLHFEIHPAWGPAIDPYPSLAAVC
jgi:murein DD-endopeptidase MepM/ murein hydrolase activator NlpD